MKNKMSLLVTVFIVGALIGGTIVWMSCFCFTKCCPGTTCGTGLDTTGIYRVSVKKANNYFRAYMDTNTIHVDTLKAFTINSEQFVAMQLISSDTSVHGFRIYMGKDDRGKPVRIVVGTGSPDKLDKIYVTSDEASGPCPFSCDVSSPIMED